MKGPRFRFLAGREGEEAVARILEGEGYTIIARNFRAGPGELDIVAGKAGLMVFVEVKTWAVYGISELGRSIGADKRRRIVETSKIFLAAHRQYSEASIRYDVFLMRGDRVEGRFEGAFTG